MSPPQNPFLENCARPSHATPGDQAGESILFIDDSHLGERRLLSTATPAIHTLPPEPSFLSIQPNPRVDIGVRREGSQPSNIQDENCRYCLASLPLPRVWIVPNSIFTRNLEPSYHLSQAVVYFYPFPPFPFPHHTC